ncbi:MAG: peptidoglycan-binding protein [Methylococcaceae bacterium]|nr:peptidoglycan-binding protein [Methylococcaceae bacterium]
MNGIGTNKIIKWVVTFTCFVVAQLAFANPNIQINDQINRTISNSINNNISKSVMKAGQFSEIGLSNNTIKDKEQIKQAQKRLSILGFNPGPVDGIMGIKTKKAIRGFQKSQGIKQDGVLTEGLLLKFQQ